MQPAPRQLVALASHHEAAKRHPDAVQPQPANGVQLLKTSMGATLVGPAGQPSLFSVAGIPSPAGSMPPQQQLLLPGQQLLGNPSQGAFIQGHQAAPVGVMVASRGTHAPHRRTFHSLNDAAAPIFQSLPCMHPPACWGAFATGNAKYASQLVNGPSGATAQVNSAQQIFLAPQPQGAQVLLPNASAALSGHLLGQLLPLGAGGTQQVVQVVAGNGTVLTTTLGNLPALSQQLSLAAALASAGGAAAAKQPATLMPHFQQMAAPQQQHNGHVAMATHHPQQQQQPPQQQLFAAAPGNYAALAPSASPAMTAATMPQLYANINGQLVAVSPQVLGQPMPSGQLVLQPQGLPMSPMLMLNTAAPTAGAQPQQPQPVMVPEEEEEGDESEGDVKEEDEDYQQQQQPPEDAYASESPRELAEPPDEDDNSDPAEILGMSAVSPDIQQTAGPSIMLQANHAPMCSAAETPVLVPSPPVSIVPLTSMPVSSGLVGCSPVSIAPVSSIPVTSTPAADVPVTSSSSGASIPRPEATISHTEANVVDGIDLEEIKHFAKAFKLRRLSLGLTQTQVGLALTSSEGPSYSQSAICRFEKLDITPKSAQKIKPVLERWMREAEERLQSGGSHALADLVGSGAEPAKKRKQRTSFTPAALEVLNRFFEKSTHPTGAEMTELAEQLSYDREVVRVWFCNKRQAYKNTVKRLKVGGGVDGPLPLSEGTSDSLGSVPPSSNAPEASASPMDCAENNTL
ncbi:POU-domain protein pdm3 isoform X2 [Amblyomma americanum]